MALALASLQWLIARQTKGSRFPAKLIIAYFVLGYVCEPSGSFDTDRLVKCADHFLSSLK